MDERGAGCGPLYACYLAARRDDEAAMQSAWRDVERDAASRGKAFDESPTTTVDESLTAAVDESLTAAVDESLTAAVDDGETERVATMLEAHVFRDEPVDRLDGPVATAVGTLLWAFGYVAAFILFFRAQSRETVVDRLRRAYRTVGVNVSAVESVGGVERTVFRCPYRNVGADRWGQRRVCHDVLDRVDDGYVTFLERHRDLDYDRPRPCAGGPCCYSEVAEG